MHSATATSYSLVTVAIVPATLRQLTRLHADATLIAGLARTARESAEAAGPGAECPDTIPHTLALLAERAALVADGSDYLGSEGHAIGHAIHDAQRIARLARMAQDAGSQAWCGAGSARALRRVLRGLDFWAEVLANDVECVREGVALPALAASYRTMTTAGYAYAVHTHA